jgi:hypothetical protein
VFPSFALRRDDGENHRHGIFYTPDWVVQFLIRETLSPQLALIEQSADVERARSAQSEEARSQGGPFSLALSASISFAVKFVVCPQYSPQGFVPALITREILLRQTELKPGKLLGLLCVSVCLAFSAFWELLEWRIAVAFYEKNAAAWLGMQGDIWDAQWDMFMALCGATAAIMFLSGVHDRSTAEVLRGPD